LGVSLKAPAGFLDAHLHKSCHTYQRPEPGLGSEQLAEKPQGFSNELAPIIKPIHKKSSTHQEIYQNQSFFVQGFAIFPS
jgi:hypothetical protein